MSLLPFFPATWCARPPRIIALLSALLWTAGASGTLVFGQDLPASGGDQADPDAVPAGASFATHAAPLLQRYCVGCHNADDREGDLSVETFADLMEGGETGPAIVPGDPAGSLMVQVLRREVRPFMPPKDEPKPSADAVARLADWIAEGAAPPAPEERDRPLLAVPAIPPASGMLPAATALAFSPAGDLLAVGRFREITLHDATTLRPIRRLTGAPGKVNALHFAVVGTERQLRLVAASGVAGLYGEALIWDVESDDPSEGEPILRLGARSHRDLLADAEMSPDASVVATAGYDRIIRLWDVASGDLLREIEGHNGAVFDLAFSPDGQVLASASADETVKLWSVQSGDRLDTLNQPLKEQLVVAFSPDGRHLVCAGADNRIRLYQFLAGDGTARTSSLVQSVFAHERPISAIALSSDGRWLVSAAEDRSLSLWSFPALEPARDFGLLTAVPSAIAVAPEGRSFLVAGLDGSVESLALAPRLTPAPPSEVPDRRDQSVHVSAAAAGEDTSAHGTEDAIAEIAESSIGASDPVPVPCRISGVIGTPGESDVFRFRAGAGDVLVLDVVAARADPPSPLDSRIQVLDAQGRPVERVLLQAVRDSWFTFRGKDSTTSDDFRLHNWEEMELNEYLYANGEVAKLWLYPRGPDSGFKVYPGFGNRFTYFGTTARTHALGEPCYIVRPHPPGSVLAPNGLPVFTLHYANDDDPRRRWDRDSHLLFEAPVKGEYEVRVTDVRGFGGDAFTYSLTLRQAAPSFDVAVEGTNPTVSPGSGREFVLRAARHDGYQGSITVSVEGVPPGWHVASPIVIEAGQESAVGAIHALPDAVVPTAEQSAALRLRARGEIGGTIIEKEIGSLGEIKLGGPAKVLARILPADAAEERESSPDAPYVFTVRAGETITARVRITRNDFEERVGFGNEDSGRNFAHGVYVDNIGLNGLLIVEGQDEREFFITAAPWVPSGSRFVHLKAAIDGGECSLPVVLQVVEPARSASR